MKVIVCTPEDAFEYESTPVIDTICACGSRDCTKVCEWCEFPVCDECASKHMGICKACVLCEWMDDEKPDPSAKEALDRYLDEMGL